MDGTRSQVQDAALPVSVVEMQYQEVALRRERRLAVAEGVAATKMLGSVLSCRPSWWLPAVYQPLLCRLHARASFGRAAMPRGIVVQPALAKGGETVTPSSLLQEAAKQRQGPMCRQTRRLLGTKRHGNQPTAMREAGVGRVHPPRLQPAQLGRVKLGKLQMVIGDMTPGQWHKAMEPTVSAAGMLPMRMRRERVRRQQRIGAAESSVMG